MAKNKMRLYLAFWLRGPPETLKEPYHVGLMIVPKKPALEKPTCTVFHALRKFESAENGKVVMPWRFDVKRATARTTELAGLILLGKLAPDMTADGIHKILKSVHVPPLEDEPEDTEDAEDGGDTEEEETSGWNCNNWVWEAMELLAQENVIPRLPGSGQDLWRTGLEFVQKMTGTTGFTESKKSVFTCDTSGNEISSEIGPLT